MQNRSNLSLAFSDISISFKKIERWVGGVVDSNQWMMDGWWVCGLSGLPRPIRPILVELKAATTSVSWRIGTNILSV